MAYREVSMTEVKEVLRQWQAGKGKKEIARQVGLDRKTVRRYVDCAERCGVDRAQPASLSDAKLFEVLGQLALSRGRQSGRGDDWKRCIVEQERIKKGIDAGLRLTKVHRLMHRDGIDVSYWTLYRFAKTELGFGRSAPTMPVVDGEAGKELQVDTGWVVLLSPDDKGHRRRLRAWIFTPGFSRYRFVYPIERETTESAIEACEAAWSFYGGIFPVLIVDNTKAIVQIADPLEPRLNVTFLEYAQARGFHIDTARVRRPKDKARVERSVRDVRDDCFAGEVLHDVEQACRRAQTWCADEYGMRRHTRTGRMPREHFEAEEKARLLALPQEAYDVPIWCEPKVARDQHAQVACALYSLPSKLVGQKLHARADKNTVRFYHHNQLVKTHPRKPRRQRSTDPNDFPSEKTPYAMRDINFLQREAEKHGAHVGEFSRALLSGPLPWTSMRSVYALLGLAKRYGSAALDDVCARALPVQMLSIKRLERMIKLKTPIELPRLPANVIPIGKFLRAPSEFSIERDQEGEKS